MSLADLAVLLLFAAAWVVAGRLDDRARSLPRLTGRLQTAVARIRRSRR